MKLNKLFLPLIFAAFLLLAQIAAAQSIVYVSNTNNLSAGYLQRNLTIDFTTGNNPAGYTFDNISFYFEAPFPTVYTALLTQSGTTNYIGLASPNPGFSGSGYRSLVAEVPFLLLPQTDYSFTLASDGTTVDVTLDSNVNRANGWFGGGSIPVGQRLYFPYFSIAATPLSPVPEPSMFALLVVGLLLSLAVKGKSHWFRRINV